MSFRARFTLRCQNCGKVVSSRTWSKTGRCPHCQDAFSSDFLPRR